MGDATAVRQLRPTKRYAVLTVSKKNAPPTSQDSRRRSKGEGPNQEKAPPVTGDA